MNKPTEFYPSKPLSSIREKPIGVAKYKEPVFKLGEFQDRYIEVEVQVYPVTIKNVNGTVLIGVRFGQMNVLRFVDRGLLYDMKSIIKQGSIH